MFDRKFFGLRLIALREERNIPQKVIADELNVTRTQISDMENGKVGTTLDRLVKICEYYHVSADYLLGITDDPTWRGSEEE